MQKVDHEYRLELYEQGLPDRDIAEKCGVNGQAVRRWRLKRGLPVNRNKGKYIPTPYEREVVCGALYRLIKGEG